MLKVKSIALGISNLSDARYFAAYEVDYLAFPTSRNADNIAKIKEISEWVEGPKFLIELEDWDEEYIKFIKTEIDIKGVVINGLYDGPSDGLMVFEKITKSAELSSIKDNKIIIPVSLMTSLSKLQNIECFIDSNTIPGDEIKDMYNQHQGVGIALHGGEEEKVGYKSFEDQDDLIDMLLE